MFNDGDESVVTRSHICLMGERHFGAKVSTLAVLPKSTTRLGKHSTVVCLANIYIFFDNIKYIN